MGKVIGIGGCREQEIIIEDDGWWGCQQKCPVEHCFWACGSGWYLGRITKPLTLKRVQKLYEEYCEESPGGFHGAPPRSPKKSEKEV